MHYGWILDKDRALRFVQSHGFDPIVSDERGITPNYYAACIEALTILLDEKTGVIPDDPRIKIVFLCDGQYFLNPVKQGKINFHLALSVGTNYEGAIPTKDIEKLGEVIAPGVEPMWFLDMEKWTWSRRAVKSSKPSSSMCFSFSSWVLVVTVGFWRVLHHANAILSCSFVCSLLPRETQAPPVAVRHGTQHDGQRRSRQDQAQNQEEETTFGPD